MSDQGGLRAFIAGEVSAAVVVGGNNRTHKLVINARDGSSVTIRNDEPPVAHPRDRPLAPPPRPGPEPLGRQTEFETIARALAAGLPVQVYGPAGIGKSTLLRHAARGHDSIHLSAAGRGVDDLLQELFTARYADIGYRPERLPLRRFLSTVRALLVVDDFAGTAEDLAVLLDAVPACDVLIASPRRTLRSGGRSVEITGVSADVATALIARELGRPLSGPECIDAAELWQASAGNPLTLIQLAAAMRTDGGALSEYRTAEQAAFALAAHLDADARRALGVLAALPGVSVPAPVLLTLARLDHTTGVDLLARLGLAIDDGTGHRLAGSLAERVATLVAPDTAPTDLATTLISWVAAARQAHAVAAVAPVVIRVLRASVASGGCVEAVSLARIVAPVLARALRLDAWGEVLDIGRAAARAIRATRDEAYFAHESGVRLATLGKGTAAGALFTAAITLWRRVGDQHAAAATQAQAQVCGAPVPPMPAAPPELDRGSLELARMLVTKPLVLGATAAIAVAGGLALASFGGMAPRSLPEPPAIIVPTSFPVEETVENVTAPPPPPVPPERAREIPTCLTGDQLDLGEVAVGSSLERSYVYTVAPCHGSGLVPGNAYVVAAQEGAFSAASGDPRCSAWPVHPGEGPCSLVIRFRALYEGRFAAQIVIPEAGTGDPGGQHVVQITAAGKRARPKGVPPTRTARPTSTVTGTTDPTTTATTTTVTTTETTTTTTTEVEETTEGRTATSTPG
ncbi:hypothetical protein GCM10012275_51590 [Longimycelium tulufanense]|uniref:Uncharacterized protein n=1 Tax=Longimycelium tulufanense TaxID=907463 RepID=A0A8J3FW73_9PSEU|nr:hypothetical protein [Longimycelium tulufanense]GGM74558.1 hypothetical protein GCM10012275_51590 [Longimycelium tulufanense]